MRTNDQPVTCTAILPDGATCTEAAQGGQYCPEHSELGGDDPEILRLVSEHFRLELQIFWQRSNLYLVVNAAVISVYASTSQPPLRPWLGAFGLVVCVFWYVVSHGSAHWIERWRQELSRVESTASSYRIFAAMSQEASRRPWLIPSRVTQWLTVFFAALWMVLSLWSIKQ